MDTLAFRTFVEDNCGWFSGDSRETVADIEYYENEIGFQLPTSLKWLLVEHGYSDACGVENLSAMILKTREYRDSIDLPENVFILADWENAGVALLLEGQPEIICCESEDVTNFAETGCFPRTMNVFANYPAWVAHRLERETEQSDY